MNKYQIKRGRRPMAPSVKFYGSLEETIGLWISVEARRHLDTERVEVMHDPETGVVILRARNTGLKITDNNFISASGFVRRFELTPTIGFNYEVSTEDPGEIQFIVLERSIQDEKEAPISSY